MPIAAFNKRINVTLHEDMLIMLEHEAQKHFQTKSEIINQALLYYIKECNDNERL